MSLVLEIALSRSVVFIGLYVENVINCGHLPLKHNQTHYEKVSTVGSEIVFDDFSY